VIWTCEINIWRRETQNTENASTYDAVSHTKRTEQPLVERIERLAFSVSGL
jgi:hypothetical protein